MAAGTVESQCYQAHTYQLTSQPTCNLKLTLNIKDAENEHRPFPLLLCGSTVVAGAECIRVQQGFKEGGSTVCVRRDTGTIFRNCKYIGESTRPFLIK